MKISSKQMVTTSTTKGKVSHINPPPLNLWARTALELSQHKQLSISYFNSLPAFFVPSFFSLKKLYIYIYIFVGFPGAADVEPPRLAIDAGLRHRAVFRPAPVFISLRPPRTIDVPRGPFSLHGLSQAPPVRHHAAAFGVYRRAYGQEGGSAG